MMQVARLAPKLLGESAELVRGFLRRQQNDDGGFKDRAGRSDLYYTVFGIDALVALQAELPVERIEVYLRNFGDGEQLDFVHLCCLARAWAAVTGKNVTASARRLLERIETFRSRDGGYNPAGGSEFGTAYGCFLALGAYQDLRQELPEPLRMVQCLKCLETEDGAWANERSVRVGSTNATAATATLLRNLNLPINPAVGAWLLARSHPQGGFLAAPDAPLADLLSTATALYGRLTAKEMVEYFGRLYGLDEASLRHSVDALFER